MGRIVWSVSAPTEHPPRLLENRYPHPPNRYPWSARLVAFREERSTRSQRDPRLGFAYRLNEPQFGALNSRSSNARRVLHPTQRK